MSEIIETTVIVEQSTESHSAPIIAPSAEPSIIEVALPAADVIVPPKSISPIPAPVVETPSKPISSSSTTKISSKPISKGKEKADSKSKTEEEIEWQEKASRATRTSVRAKTVTPVAKGKSGKSIKEIETSEDDLADNGEEEEEEDGGVTRCVCGIDSEEAAAQLMIQCDSCKCWQHGPCVGLWMDKDCPARYFCEMCKPGWHGPGGLLRKAHRKNIAPPPPTNHNYPIRSPSIPKNKARESADAGLVSSFLSTDQIVGTIEREKSEEGSVEPVLQPSRTQRSASAVSTGPTRSTVVEGDLKAPKKRSTMNSRDAAYDDAIAMSILGPGTAAMRARLEKANHGDGSSDEEGNKSEEDKSKAVHRSGSPESTRGDLEKESEDDYTAVPSPPAKKRKRTAKENIVAEDQEMEFNGDGSDHGVIGDEMMEEDYPRDLDGSQEEDDHDLHGEGLPLRAKHPNQYTYRPKPAVTRARASPSKRATNSQQQNGNASAFTSHTSAYENPPYRAKHSQKEWASFDSSWGMPEHLRHLSHLLPSKSPIPLAVPTYQSTIIEDYSLAELEDVIFDTHLESSTKIKFPNKRMTMPEMKKRSRVVLEFIARIQVESGEKTGSKDEESSKMISQLNKDVLSFQRRYFGTTD